MTFTGVNQLSLLRRIPKGGTRCARLATAVTAAALLYAPNLVQAQSNPSIGTMVLNNLTVPRGGLWLQDNNGGHYWVADQVVGMCRVDVGAGATGFVVSNCQTAAKSAGQPVLANPAASITGLPAGAKFVLVPDYSSKSVNVVRYVFNPAGDKGNGTLSANLTFAVKNQTAVGGGSGGGRPVGAALAANGTDLYVGYLKSGDIMLVPNANSITSGSPTVTRVGTTSDGRGVESLLMFGGDLYLAELGGNGLSKIPVIAGTAGPPAKAPCTQSSPCTGTLIAPQISFFPGGLATDGTSIFVGDSPITSAGSILKYDPSTNTAVSYAVNVPAYTSTFDGQSRNQYVNPFGITVLPSVPGGSLVGGDLMISDDPSAQLAVATPPTIQGHLWRVKPPQAAPVVSGVSPSQGDIAGGITVTINGSGFSASAGATSVFFGANKSPNVQCTTTSCTAVDPAGAVGTVDVTVSVGGQTSGVTGSDQFTYVQTPGSGGAVTVSGVTPAKGLAGGGTQVTIAGTGFSAASTVTFGGIGASNVQCGDANCATLTAASPAGSGTVSVQVTTGANTSAENAAGSLFNYVTPQAKLLAWGTTAPKGGMLFVPGNLGGHYWLSSEGTGFCRLDPVASTTIYAINYSMCDDGANINSAGQAVYDPTANADGTHYIYVPDNAVKSTAVWRLTFDPATETLRPGTEAMAPLADVRTLKPNGMALGPDRNLYITDLTESNIRQLTGPAGDPRLQQVNIVAHTGDGRGANGTIGFIGNKAYISENRAATWFDITLCPPATATTSCATNPIPLPSGVFVAGVAVDPVHNMVYAADSPGGANATIWRYNIATNTTDIFVQGGTLPAKSDPEGTVRCAMTCTRPWDNRRTSGGFSGFAFAFGISVDPRDGSLLITEDPYAGSRTGLGTAWQVPYVP